MCGTRPEPLPLTVRAWGMAELDRLDPGIYAIPPVRVLLGAYALDMRSLGGP